MLPGSDDDDEDKRPADPTSEPELRRILDRREDRGANSPGPGEVRGRVSQRSPDPMPDLPSERVELKGSVRGRKRPRPPDARGRWESPVGGAAAPALVEPDDVKWDRISKIDYDAEEWTNIWGTDRSDIQDADDESDKKQWADSDARERASSRRNWNRILEANARDKRLIGKHLPKEAGVFFPFNLLGPEDYELPPTGWIKDLIEVSKQEPSTPSRPRGVVFEVSESALLKNQEELERAGWDMRNLLAAQKGTTLDPGSEFRELGVIRRVLRHHPNLPFLEEVFSGGMPYLYNRSLSEEEREQELAAQLKRGNHKSAASEIDHLSALLGKDVYHGFCLPIPKASVMKLKGCLVQPAGIVEQFSLQADGSRKRKRRLTHDLSFSAAVDGGSVNDRVDMTRYPEMIYGWCLNRLTHFTVCLRAAHPDKRIFAQKFDYADAYRRIAHHPQAAAETVLVVGLVAYVMLRLAFGGSPNPPCFCAFSEALTDLANELACCDASPEDFHVSTVRPEHLEPVLYDKEEEPIAAAILPAFEVPVTLTSRKDCFIDDIINVFLDTDRNMERESFWVPLAVHLLSRPHAGEGREPIPRRPLLGPDKLAAEGRPAEVQVILGWSFDFQRLVVSLPSDKYAAWSGDIRVIVESESVKFGEWESTVGRLNHVAFLIPLSRHFLNRLRLRLKRRMPAQQVFRLRADEVLDLKLWLDFLDTARAGLSMNLLTVRTPTRIAWSDSCPFGMGGYTQSGRAWRLRVPEHAAFRGDDTVNNVLEFLAMAINVFLLIDEAKDERFACLMPLGDNTSAIGWLFKSGRMGVKSIYYEAVQFIARAVARDPRIFHDISAAGRDKLIRLCSSANHRIVVDSKQEASHEDVDRTWRRWSRFLEELGISDYFLDEVPKSGRGILVKGFLIAMREAKFDREGRIVGKRSKPMVASTLRDATGFLGQAFRRSERQSPVHSADTAFGRSSLLAPIKDLLKALEKCDPPPARQAAATPELLVCANHLAACFGEEAQHTADLTTGAFFFAMRACEFCETPNRGRTKLLTLKNVTFRDQKKKIIPHDHPDLGRLARYVTICFVDQKNGERMDRRTQGPSGKPGLCPILAWVRVVQRVRAHNPGASDDTPVCELRTSCGEKSRVSAEQVADSLKRACRFFGGESRFGFGPEDLGTRSIRSGAAMSLFIMDHSVEKIKILGRWSSDAFLVYIRPQVLEWTSIMAEDMASTRNFLDLTYARSQRDDSERNQWRNLGTMFPSFHIGR